MKLIFTCGGTAGHINPALGVAQRMQSLLPDCEILFVGAEGQMETELVPREGFPIKTVKITNISRSLSMEGLKHNLDTVKNVLTATAQAKKIIADFKPDAVIGMGAMSATLFCVRPTAWVSPPPSTRATPCRG